MSETATVPIPKPKRPKRGNPADLPLGTNVLFSPAMVCAAIHRDYREFQRLRARGGFPPPDSPEGERPKWKLSTVNRWIEEHYSHGQRLPQASQREA